MITDAIWLKNGKKIYFFTIIFVIVAIFTHSYRNQYIIIHDLTIAYHRTYYT